MLIHHDKHNNLFIPFGSYHLENNVTKAFINLLSLINKDTALDFISNFLSINGNKESYTLSFYLQSGPSNSIRESIHNLSSDKKKLVALNPSGKTWDNSLLDKNKKDNESNMKKELINQVKLSKSESNYTDKSIEGITKEVLEETNEMIEYGGSVPDAWILIYKNQQLESCLIIETKLYDLNPLQLRNHAEKSLNIDLTNSKDYLHCKKFKDIYIYFFDKLSQFKQIEGRVVGDFLEYLTILGLESNISLSQSELDFYDTLSELKPFDEPFYKRILTNKLDQYISNLIVKSSLDCLKKDNRLYFNDLDEINSVMEIDLENKKIIFSTEVGVKHRNTSEKVINKLQTNSQFSNKLLSFYDDKATFQRFIRVYPGYKPDYIFLNEFNSLDDYLIDVEDTQLFKYYSKSNLDAFFNDKGMDSNSDEYNGYYESLKMGASQEWHVLEYFRIIQPIYLIENGMFDPKRLEEKVVQTLDNIHDAAKYIEKNK